MKNGVCIQTSAFPTSATSPIMSSKWRAATGKSRGGSFFSHLGTTRDMAYDVAMDDALRHARLAALRDEMDAIHLANKLYWSSTGRSHEADMEHQLRQERLDQLRREMDELEAQERSIA
jgi:hypothetical protein